MQSMKRLFTTLVLAYFSITAYSQTACNVQVVGVEGVECRLLYDAQSNVLIMPCSWPQGLPYFQVGDSLVISYTPGNCMSFCMQGQYSDITCGTYSNRPSGIENNSTSEALTIYPQPASEVLMFSMADKVSKVSIYNSLGQLLSTRADVSDNSINISMLGAGIYLFHFEGAGLSELRKVSVIK